MVEVSRAVLESAHPWGREPVLASLRHWFLLAVFAFVPDDRIPASFKLNLSLSFICSTPLFRGFLFHPSCHLFSGAKYHLWVTLPSLFDQWTFRELNEIRSMWNLNFISVNFQALIIQQMYPLKSIVLRISRRSTRGENIYFLCGREVGNGTMDKKVRHL